MYARHGQYYSRSAPDFPVEPLNGISLFQGCFSALLGMDCFEHPGNELYPGLGDHTEYVAVKMDNTPLVFGFRKHFAHCLKHTEALVADNEFNAV